MNDPADICPKCASKDIAPIETPPKADDENLVVDVPSRQAERPNMRCASCGHTWWLAPNQPELRGDVEGVAD